MKLSDYIERFRMVHMDEYTYNYIKDNKYVSFNCKIHGEIITAISIHLGGSKCMKCVNDNKRTDRKTLINKFRKIHGNKYDYDLVEYTNTHGKIKIKCKKHGVFITTPHRHIRGQVCHKCTIEKRRKKLKDSFIKRSIEVHGDKYGYENVVYVTAKKPVLIKCRLHGLFKQMPNSHLNGRGCKECAEISRSKTKTKTTEQFIIEAKFIHKDKYNYSKTIYNGRHSKLMIICNKHGKFMQDAGSHLSGNGCPRCKSSRGEILIEDILTDMCIEFIREYKIEGYRYRYDFYVPESNLLIEYDGIQHFKPIKRFGGVKAFKRTKRSDTIKDRLAKDKGFDLLRISYVNFNKIKDILLDNMVYQSR